MKIEVDVTTFDVLEEVIAEPGDKLLVWKGKYIVGVLHKGEATVPSAIATALGIDEDRVVVILGGTKEGVNMRVLADEYGFERGDIKGRAKMGDVVAKLVKAGTIRKNPHDEGMRYPRYQVPPAARHPHPGGAD